MNRLDSNQFEIISKNTVDSSEKRIQYYNFLIKNVQFSPIEKLFGTSILVEPTPKLICKQVKKLSVHIHPDKVREEERQLCTDLFQLVQAVQQEALPKDRGLLSALLRPDLFLRDYIEKQQWEKALDEWSSLDNKLPYVGALIHCNLGDLGKALNLIPDKEIDLKGMWVSCNAWLLSPDKSAINGMIDLIEKMKLFKATPYSMRIIPYQLPLAIFENLRCTGKEFKLQEKYLREAIRYCPDTLRELKRNLIITLVEHKARYCDTTPLLLFAEVISKRLNLWKENLIKILNQYNLSDAAAFLDDNQWPEAAQSINKYISNYSSGWLSLNNWKRWGKELLSNDGSYREYDKIESDLQRCSQIIQAFHYFNNSDYDKSKHYFELSNLELELALVQFITKEYSISALSFSRVMKNEIKSSQNFELTVTCLYFVMNYCDTEQFFLEKSLSYTNLGPVDDTQFEVLQRFYKE